MARILHTSDWHLGALLESVSREEDHRHFLQWLLQTLDHENIDALVISGDIFDQAHPSAEAQSLYFGFLHDLQKTKVRTVVIIGGNHDSPSRLDAPRELLKKLKIHVIGGLPFDKSRWHECVCPLVSPEGQTEAVFIAIPFVHEFRLGIRTSMTDEATIRDTFFERLQTLYREFCNEAQQRFPDVPLIGTGHLTCLGADPADAPADIHLVGTIGGIAPTVFDERFQYLALGHIHKSYRVKSSRAWYAGSPIPLNTTEAKTARRVLLVDTVPALEEPAQVRPIEIPLYRSILEIKGDLNTVKEQIRTLSWTTPEPPLLFATVQIEAFSSGLTEILQQQIAMHGASAPRLLRVSQQLVCRADAEDSLAPAVQKRNLKDLTPEEVFLQLCTYQGETPDDSLLQAFRTLLVTDEEQAR